MGTNILLYGATGYSGRLIAAEAKKQIEEAGTLKHENEWGLRKMAYEIKQRNEADYRFFRFVGDNALLEGLRARPAHCAE